MRTKVTKKQIEESAGSLEQFGVKSYNARLYGIHYETKPSNNSQLIKLKFDGSEEIICVSIQSKVDFVNAIYRDLNKSKEANKPTKKQIIAELRSLDCTRIHRIAARCGVDAGKMYDVIDFIHNHAPSIKINQKLCDIVRKRDYIKNATLYAVKYKEPTIKRICREMKEQIKCGYSSYSKILIEGSESIFWASPVHLHSDYNKSGAMTNTERNRKIMTLVNNHLAKHGIK